MLTLANDVIAKQLLTAADSLFLRLDHITGDGIEQPTHALVTGSEQSLVPWDGIGRYGKSFIAGGPTQQELSDFSQRTAKRPIRVYVGQRNAKTVEQRVKMAFAKLKRVGAFQRKVLVVLRRQALVGSTQMLSIRSNTSTTATRLW